MAEVAFLEAVTAFLEGSAGLDPVPGTVGFAIPVQGDTLPLIALSLSDVARVDIGLGGGATEVSEGALQAVATVDLADPVLPGPDGFLLLDETRTELTLPHGGLIRADALDDVIGPADLTVTVDSVPRNLSVGTPGASEFQANPLVGVLVFGAPLPATGTLVATYHLGIWERRTTLITGAVDVAVWDSDVLRLAGISGAAVRALIAGVDGTLPGLKKIALRTLSEIEPPQVLDPFARRRLAGFSFEYEHVVDAHVSSGGIIGSVPITSRLAAFIRDSETGAPVEAVEIETEE